MELNVGNYVRTKDGHIDKIVKISDEMKSGRTIKVQIGEIDNIGGYEDFVDWFSPGHFIKSSPNIIDLIEVGDVIKKRYKTGLIEKIPINKIEDKERIKTDLKNGFKLSIITHEQFEAMQYAVGEE